MVAMFALIDFHPSSFRVLWPNQTLWIHSQYLPSGGIKGGDSFPDRYEQWFLMFTTEKHI